MQLIIKQIYQFLATKSQSFILTVGLSLVIVIGMLDYVTGSGLEIDFFYLLPLAMVTWFVSTQAGVATAVLATLVWALANKVISQISPFGVGDLWNTSIELALFLVFVGLLLMLKREVRKLDELASEDSLTGVANRRSFNRVAVAEMNRSRRFGAPFSVVYIDIDGFKRINDTQGHNVGDTLLRKVATTIREHIRDVDTVARLGGDEFVILFPETNADETKHIIERVQRHLADSVDNHSWPVTFSIGVMTFSEPPTSAEEMMGFADRVMYSVKKQGKNGISFASWPDLE
jgi:diguanylate cyclase (GGDEF)-like protein